MAIKDISFSTAFLQGKKLADHTAREKKKKTYFAETTAIDSNK
jgi:hypothetical protein